MLMNGKCEGMNEETRLFIFIRQMKWLESASLIEYLFLSLVRKL